MVSKRLQLIPLLALLLLAPCHGDERKTVLDGHHLENKTVGFYGFAVDVPLDYEPYSPPQGKDYKIKTYADAAWVYASGLDRHAGFSTSEIIPFQTNDRGLMVVVTATTLQIPPIKRENEHRRFLDMFMSWAVKHTPTDVTREIRKIGDLQEGRYVNSKDGIVFAANIVLIPPATVLTFCGVCPEARKGDLLADLDSAIATLNIGKRTLP